MMSSWCVLWTASGNLMPMTLQNLRLLPQHWHQNLQWWLWYGLMAVLPYTIVQSTRFTGIFTIGLISNAVLFLQGWQHLPPRLKEAKPVLLGLGLYLVQVLFTPFSQNVEEGTHLLSVRLGMVWIPLVLFLLPPPAHVIRTMVWVLALSVFSVLLISQREGLIWLQDCPPCYLDELCPLPKPYIPLFTLGAAALVGSNLHASVIIGQGGRSCSRRGLRAWGVSGAGVCAHLWPQQAAATRTGRPRRARALTWRQAGRMGRCRRRSRAQGASPRLCAGRAHATGRAHAGHPHPPRRAGGRPDKQRSRAPAPPTGGCHLSQCHVHLLGNRQLLVHK
jgi:hypothetical protein